MLQLRAFEAADDDALISWFPDEEALRRWAGPGPRWPLDQAQLASRRAESHVQAWTAYFDGAPGEPVGHVELVSGAEREGRIDRVAIAPEHRGHRLGAALVQAALDVARSSGLHSVDLLVFSANFPAARTYQKLGFTDRGPISPDYPEVRRMALDFDEADFDEADFDEADLDGV